MTSSSSSSEPEREPEPVAEDPHLHANAKALAGVLHLDCSEARSLFEGAPSLRSRPLVDVRGAAEELVLRGVRREDVLENPAILEVPLSQLAFKVNLAERTSNFPLSQCHPLLAAKMKRLLFLNKQLSFDLMGMHGKTRPEYISHSLGISPTDACRLFPRYQFLPNVPAPKVVAVFELLLGAGVKPVDIVNDMWIIRYNLELMEKRVDEARNRGVPIKPWLLRCPESRFQKSVASYVENENVCGPSSDLMLYVANRLDCTLDDVKEKFGRFPPLQGLSPRKVKHGLDVLFDAGFTADQILNGLRVLAYSPEKIRQRLELLKSHEKYTFLVGPLSWPDRDFCKFYGLPNPKRSRGND